MFRVYRSTRQWNLGDTGEREGRISNNENITGKWFNEVNTSTNKFVGVVVHDDLYIT